MASSEAFMEVPPTQGKCDKCGSPSFHFLAQRVGVITERWWLVCIVCYHQTGADVGWAKNRAREQPDRIRDSHNLLERVLDTSEHRGEFIELWDKTFAEIHGFAYELPFPTNDPASLVVAQMFWVRSLAAVTMAAELGFPYDLVALWALGVVQIDLEGLRQEAGLEDFEDSFLKLAANPEPA